MCRNVTTENYKMKLSPDTDKTITLTIEKEVFDVVNDWEITNQISEFIFKHLKFTYSTYVYTWVTTGCVRGNDYKKIKNYIEDRDPTWTFDASKDFDNGNLTIVLKKHQQEVIIEQINN